MLSAGRGSLCATGYCRSRCLWGQAVPVVTGEALLLLLMRLPCSGVRSVTAAAGGAAAQQPVTYHMSVALCHVILIRPCWVRVRVRVWVPGCVCECVRVRRAHFCWLNHVCLCLQLPRKIQNLRTSTFVQLIFTLLESNIIEPKCTKVKR